jgi:hypothetical protein
MAKSSRSATRILLLLVLLICVSRFNVKTVSAGFSWCTNNDTECWTTWCDVESISCEWGRPHLEHCLYLDDWDCSEEVEFECCHYADEL